MQSNIIERLFTSFTDLEQAINSAKATLAKKDAVPNDIIERLNSYDGILEKQRALASALCGHIAKENWSEVTRHVSLINGLSAMIRDDARSILSSLTVETESSKESSDPDLNFC